MIEKIKNNQFLPRLINRSSGLFMLISVVIILLSVANWQLELKPRLHNEAIQNTRIIASSKAQAIEALFQNIQRREDFATIHNAINELLLLNDPDSGEMLFLGVQLEIDFDAFPVSYGMINISSGNASCTDCIKTENPIYNRETGELIAIINIYSNPVFYQRLLQDVRTQLGWVLIAVLIIILIAWRLVNRLLSQLQEREKSLVFEISERKNAEEKLHQIATYDQLTNLPNRYLLHSEFNQKLKEAERYDNMLAVLFFDLDHFKTINDIYGHETGDLLLQEVSKRITALIRTNDLLARFGGDEFVMIMPHINDVTDIYPVIDKILQTFAVEFLLDSVQVEVTTSIGISVYPQDGKTTSTLLKNADLAMYMAKSEGRNRHHFFTHQMNDDLKRSQWIESNLKNAINDDKLTIFFQPQVNTNSQEIESCEALIRWPQQDGSFISPSEFIPIAERTGLIHEISDWVYDKVCQYQENWSQQGLSVIRTDINLSGKDFANTQVIEALIQKLTIDKREHCLVGIEITENILLKSNNKLIEQLRYLHQSKVHIAIDDFGSGYSSLNYLKNFPASSLKIDQAFIRHAHDNKKDKIILQAIVAVGHGLGLEVVAEGVENAEHLQLIETIGCDKAQGYHFSEPLPAEEFSLKYLSTKH